MDECLSSLCSTINDYVASLSLQTAQFMNLYKGNELHHKHTPAKLTQALEKDLNNPIINAAFLLLYKDLIRLFASYNEGMINLIEKYFSLKRRQCRLGMDLYHAFPGLLSKLTEFLTLAESLGIGDKDSLGLRPVPEKVIQAMEQHLQILESKKGSDDEGEDSSDTRASTKPGIPKKPTLPVPMPNQAANLTEANKLAAHPHTHTDDTSNINLENEPHGSANTSRVSEQLNDSTDSTFSHPAVIVNDEDGLPSALQEEIIATARGHLNETIVKSTEAVKRSTQHGAVNVPVHTQLGRSEHRTVSVPPTRSRSPSPARPPPASPVHNVVSTPKQPSISVSDSEAIEDDNEEQLNINKAKHNLSLLGLNQEANAQTGASSVCASPFAGDEEPVAPVTDTTTSWSDKPPAHTEPVHGTGGSSSQPSAIDDLLGLDLLSTDPIPQTNIEPIPISVQQIGSTGEDSSKPSFVNINTTTASATSHAAALDDLLSLYPLLEKDSSSDGATANAYQPSTNPPGSFNNSLPAGLKPVPSTVPIRPAVVLSASQNKNPLDALDSTLSNLASSLGGQQAWGSANMKKKPLAESEKPM